MPVMQQDKYMVHQEVQDNRNKKVDVRNGIKKFLKHTRMANKGVVKSTVDSFGVNTNEKYDQP